MGRGAGSPSNTMSPGLRPTSLPSYQVAFSSIQPFRHNRHGPKIGGCDPVEEESWVTHLTQYRLGEAYLRTKWHLDPSNRLATTETGRKLGTVPLWGGGAGSPSNTVWPGPRPTSVPSFILIHPADMGRKKLGRGCCALFGWGSWVPYLTRCGLGLRTKWHLDPSSRLATIDMGRGLYGRRQGLRP